MMYEPTLVYLCPDPECCDNGCPSVTCKHCGHDWPCADYIATHNPTQIEAQHRYVSRKWWGNDTHMIEYDSRLRGWEGNKK